MQKQQAAESRRIDMMCAYEINQALHFLLKSLNIHGSVANDDLLVLTSSPKGEKLLSFNEFAGATEAD